MVITAAAILFVFLAGTIVWVGLRFTSRGGRVAEQLAGVGVEGFQSAPAQPAASVSALYKVTTMLEGLGNALPADPLSASLTRRQLIAAGYRSEAALPVYQALRILTIALFLALGFFLATVFDVRLLLRGVIFIIPASIGFFLPGAALDFLVDKRHEVLRFALPDALDLLVVCVEAGLGLDQALRNVCEELRTTHPELCEELALVNFETRTGVKRTEALHHLAERTMEPEIGKLVAILMQTERFGTSVADSLRVHSEFMRVRRRQEAEERAGKLGVKLIIVVFLFIMPAMVVVTAGPSILGIGTKLMPLLGGEGGGR
jgi:tight adherence protein C